MADGVAITAGSGTTISTDDADASGHVQRVKLTYSADGSATHIDADANGLLVNLGTNNDVTVTSGTVTANLAAGTNNIGDVDVLSIAAGTNYIGRVRLTDGTTDTNVSSTGALFIGGAVAHDGIDSGNPVKLGMRALAHGTNPKAVAAADRTDWLANRHGIPWMIGGHPNIITRTARVAAADGVQTGIAIGPTIAAGTKMVITRLMVTASNANTVNVRAKVAFSTSTTLPTDATTGTAGIIADNVVPPGGGYSIGSAAGIVAIGADDEELRWTVDPAPTSGHITCSFSYYTIES